jgi:hypothetical protein
VSVLKPLKYFGAVRAEGGGWLVLRRPEPALAGLSAAGLLARTARLPGNLRHAPAPGGGVELLGDLCYDPAAEVFPVARARLRELLTARPGREPPSEGAVEAALDAAGLAWARREAGWVIPPAGPVPRELAVRRAPGGVRVEAVLAEWDALGEEPRAALARFLVAAQAGLRGARCERDDRGARICSWADARRLEADLGPSLRSVGGGCRLLAREARALLIPEVARAYGAFHGLSGEPPAAPTAG